MYCVGVGVLGGSHTALPRGQFAVDLKIKKIYFCALHITTTIIFVYGDRFEIVLLV